MADVGNTSSPARPVRRTLLAPDDAREAVFFGSANVFYHVHRRPNIVCKVPWQNATDTERFQVEKRAYDRLRRHPHIVKVLATTDRAIYMEEVKFRDLREYFRRGGLPTLSERLAWSLDIASAVAYAHRQDVRHAALSCRKVLLGRDRAVLLCGFGAASVDGERPCAPPPREAGLRHADGEPVERQTMRAELFALGSVVYEIVAGRVPHAEVELAEREARFARGEWPDVAGLPLGEAMEGCWRGTFRSAAEVAAEVARLGTFGSVGSLLGRN
jgi:serine/threonine protein kinase